MLHDFDYEKYPTEQDHVCRGMEILRERGWPENVIKAIGGHAFYTNIPRETPMEKAILAADELTGFVGACALIRPTKKIADVPVESVLKRLKEKSFARTVDRSYVTNGAEEWGLPAPRPRRARSSRRRSRSPTASASAARRRPTSRTTPTRPSLPRREARGRGRKKEDSSNGSRAFRRDGVARADAVRRHGPLRILRGARPAGRRASKRRREFL